MLSICYLILLRSYHEPSAMSANGKLGDQIKVTPYRTNPMIPYIINQPPTIRTSFSCSLSICGEDKQRVLILQLHIHSLSALVVIEAESTLGGKTVSPEALNGLSIRLGVCSKEPETENWLGENIENSVGDDLTIDGEDAGSITKTPDNWVESPEDEGESTDGGKELGGLVVLVGSSTASTKSDNPNNGDVCNTGHGVVSPLLTLGATEGGEETSENHDKIGNNGDSDVGTVQASEEGKIEEEKWCGDGPVDVTTPEDLAENIIGDIWSVLVLVLDLNVGE